MPVVTHGGHGHRMAEDEKCVSFERFFFQGHPAPSGQASVLQKGDPHSRPHRGTHPYEPLVPTRHAAALKLHGLALLSWESGGRGARARPSCILPTALRAFRRMLASLIGKYLTPKSKKPRTLALRRRAGQLSGSSPPSFPGLEAAAVAEVPFRVATPE